MTAATVDFVGQQSEEQRRRMRHALLASVGAHFVVAGILFFAPSPGPAPLPDVISIDLIAPAPPSAAPRPVPPAPKPAAAPKPAPAPPPEPVAPPAPPPEAVAPPAPKTTVLPKDTPETVRKAKPTPAPVVRPPKPKELSKADALAQLRAELGEDAPAAPPSPVEKTDAPAEASSAPTGTAQISPELRDWIIATTRRIRSAWVMPPEFRDRRLATMLSLELSASGALLGTPEVVRSSGDPFFDDNAVRAMQKAAPLPPPPAPGERSFIFRSEENQ